MSTKTLKLRKTQKCTFLKIQKSTKHRVHTKQRNGRTKNKHCNILIYTVPRNRVLIEHCYYNIQTIKYHNNAELIFLQHIFRRRQRTLWNFEKHKNLHFSKSKKQKYKVHTKQEYIQNNGTGEPKINNSICRFTQSHSTECWLNLVTTIFKQQSTTIMLNWYFYNNVPWWLR